MRVLRYFAGGLAAAVLLYVLSSGPVIAFVAIRSNFHPPSIKEVTETWYSPVFVVGYYLVPRWQEVSHGYYELSLQAMKPFIHPKPGAVAPH